MSLRTAAQQALEALEDIADELISPYNDPIGKAILDLRTALAEPDDTALLRQALEALEKMLDDAKHECVTVTHWNDCVDTITALRERLGEKT
jgi:hypothetical protein